MSDLGKLAATGDEEQPAKSSSIEDRIIGGGVSINGEKSFNADDKLMHSGTSVNSYNQSATEQQQNLHVQQFVQDSFKPSAIVRVGSFGSIASVDSETESPHASASVRNVAHSTAGPPLSPPKQQQQQQKNDQQQQQSFMNTAAASGGGGGVVTFVSPDASNLGTEKSQSSHRQSLSGFGGTGIFLPNALVGNTSTTGSDSVGWATSIGEFGGGAGASQSANNNQSSSASSPLVAATKLIMSRIFGTNPIFAASMMLQQRSQRSASTASENNNNNNNTNNSSLNPDGEDGSSGADERERKQSLTSSDQSSEARRKESNASNEAGIITVLKSSKSVKDDEEEKPTEQNKNEQKQQQAQQTKPNNTTAGTASPPLKIQQPASSRTTSPKTPQQRSPHQIQQQQQQENLTTLATISDTQQAQLHRLLLETKRDIIPELIKHLKDSFSDIFKEADVPPDTTEQLKSRIGDVIQLISVATSSVSAPSSKNNSSALPENNNINDSKNASSSSTTAANHNNNNNPVVDRLGTQLIDELVEEIDKYERQKLISELLSNQSDHSSPTSPPGGMNYFCATTTNSYHDDNNNNNNNNESSSFQQRSPRNMPLRATLSQTQMLSKIASEPSMTPVYRGETMACMSPNSSRKKDDDDDDDEDEKSSSSPPPPSSNNTNGIRSRGATIIGANNNSGAVSNKKSDPFTLSQIGGNVTSISLNPADISGAPVGGITGSVTIDEVTTEDITSHNNSRSGTPSFKNNKKNQLFLGGGTKNGCRQEKQQENSFLKASTEMFSGSRTMTYNQTSEAPVSSSSKESDNGKANSRNDNNNKNNNSINNNNTDTSNSNTYNDEDEFGKSLLTPSPPKMPNTSGRHSSQSPSTARATIVEKSLIVESENENSQKLKIVSFNNSSSTHPTIQVPQIIETQSPQDSGNLSSGGDSHNNSNKNSKHHENKKRLSPRNLNFQANNTTSSNGSSTSVSGAIDRDMLNRTAVFGATLKLGGSSKSANEDEEEEDDDGTATRGYASTAASRQTSNLSVALLGVRQHSSHLFSSSQNPSGHDFSGGGGGNSGNPLLLARDTTSSFHHPQLNHQQQQNTIANLHAQLELMTRTATFWKNQFTKVSQVMLKSVLNAQQKAARHYDAAEDVFSSISKERTFFRDQQQALMAQLIKQQHQNRYTFQPPNARGGAHHHHHHRGSGGAGGGGGGGVSRSKFPTGAQLSGGPDNANSSTSSDPGHHFGGSSAVRIMSANAAARMNNRRSMVRFEESPSNVTTSSAGADPNSPGINSNDNNSTGFDSSARKNSSAKGHHSGSIIMGSMNYSSNNPTMGRANSRRLSTSGIGGGGMSMDRKPSLRLAAAPSNVPKSHERFQRRLSMARAQSLSQQQMMMVNNNNNDPCDIPQFEGSGGGGDGGNLDSSGRRQSGESNNNNNNNNYYNYNANNAFNNNNSNLGSPIGSQNPDGLQGGKPQFSDDNRKPSLFQVLGDPDSPRTSIRFVPTSQQQQLFEFVQEQQSNFSTTNYNNTSQHQQQRIPSMMLPSRNPANMSRGLSFAGNMSVTSDISVQSYTPGQLQNVIESHVFANASTTENILDVLDDGEGTGNDYNTGEMPQINQYQVLDKLGKGAQAPVFLALDQESMEPVAIKIVSRPVIKPELADSPLMAGKRRIVAAVRREIAAMKRCRHQNLVQLLEVIDDSSVDHIFLIIEYMSGGCSQLPRTAECIESGSKIIDGSFNRRYSARRVIQFGRRLCAALQYLHERGIVHRDIKPENVLLRENGEPCLADFGISELMDQTATGSSTTKRKNKRATFDAQLTSHPLFAENNNNNSYSGSGEPAPYEPERSPLLPPSGGAASDLPGNDDAHHANSNSNNNDASALLPQGSPAAPQLQPPRQTGSNLTSTGGGGSSGGAVSNSSNYHSGYVSASAGSGGGGSGHAEAAIQFAGTVAFLSPEGLKEMYPEVVQEVKAEISDLLSKKPLDSHVASPIQTFEKQSQLSPIELKFAGDVWSLGMTLFTMLTGRLPYPATSMRSYVRGVMRSALNGSLGLLSDEEDGINGLLNSMTPPMQSAAWNEESYVAEFKDRYPDIFGQDVPLAEIDEGLVKDAKGSVADQLQSDDSKAACQDLLRLLKKMLTLDPDARIDIEAARIAFKKIDKKYNADLIETWEASHRGGPGGARGGGGGGIGGFW